MKLQLTEEQKYLRAAKRVKDIKGFYIHFTIYCIIIPTLIFINLKFEPSYHWFWFSLFGWGTGLFFHWFSIFGFKYIGLGKDWEDKKINEFIKNQEN